MDDLVQLVKRHLKNTRPAVANDTQVNELLSEMELQGCSGQDAIDTLNHYHMQTGLSIRVKQMCFDALYKLKQELQV